MNENNFLCNTLFIIPLHAFFRSIIADSGLKTIPPYRGKNNVFLRVLREIHFRLNLPWKKLWYTPINGSYENFFIIEGLMRPEYIEWLHGKYPDSKFVMFYMNKCNNATNPNKFRFEYLNLWTGDINDATQYGLNLCPNAGSYVKSWVVKKQKPEYDIFFIGKDKGGKRLGELMQLEETFRQIGLTTYFHIVAERKYERYKKPQYKGFMSYSESLKYLGKSKAILYLGFGSQECVTIRVQESLVHKIKLITDCSWIKKYDFYNPKNIFILGEDDMNKLPEFLNTPYVEVEASILKHIYFEDLAKEIINLSK